jgi:hypothetical protein
MESSFIGKIMRQVGTGDDSVTFVEVPHVCILESPSAQDILDNRREGFALSEALGLAGIRNEYFAICDRDTLGIAVKRVCAFAASRKLSPLTGAAGEFFSHPRLFLHFSGHGNEDGLGLTNGDFIPWEELTGIVADMTKGLGLCHGEDVPVSLVALCMSSCCGLHGRKMAVDPKACPFVFLVGPHKPVSWNDSLTAYITFYHQLINKRRTLGRAVMGMNQAAMLQDAFQAVTPADLGVEGFQKAVKVVLMMMTQSGCLVYKHHDKNAEKPLVLAKDQFMCVETKQPFPFFDSADAALEYMQKNLDELCQVEYGAATDMMIYHSQK